jgi:hypothetical protein
MARLVWGEVSERTYEVGVDRGVLYPQNGFGVAWNGLTGIDQSADGAEVSSYYYDGIKYIDLVGQRSYKATLNAFSAPEEFAYQVGDQALVPGFIFTKQARQRFGLAYRTMIEPERGYKIHLLYNALATPTGRSHSTLNDEQSVGTFSWSIDAVPVAVAGFRPSAHFVIDSTKMEPDALEAIEKILYGSATSEPRLPTVDELLDFMVDWVSLIVVPDTVTGLADLVPGLGDMYRMRIAGLHKALPETRLVETATEGFYTLEE